MDEKEKKDLDLERLRGMDLGEVANATHIEVENLKAILDKDFQKLANFNVAGYIKILEREFGLDLSEWLSEFRAAKASFEPNKRAHVEKVYARASGSKREGGGWIIWLVAIFLIIAAIFYFELHKKFNEFLGSVLNEETNATYSDNSVVSDTQKQLENVGIKPYESSRALEFNASAYSVSDYNASAPNALDRSIQIIKAEANVSDANASDSNASDNNTSAKFSPSDELKLTPHVKIWLGIINLTTGKKREFVTSESYTLSASDELLIATGHGMFDIGKPGDPVKFSEKNTIKLHIKNGEINKISNEEFIRLNKGKKW